MTAKQIGRKIKGEVGEFVSRHLNNTPAICKKNYINNRLLSTIIETPKKYLSEVVGIKPGKPLHSYLATLI
jgi:DNA topoisomerase IB